MWQFKVVAIRENVAIIDLKLITAVFSAVISSIFVTISPLHHLKFFRLPTYFFQIPTTLASLFGLPLLYFRYFPLTHILSLSLSLSHGSSLTHFPSSSLLLYSKPTISFPKFQTQKYNPKPKTLPKAR